MNFQARQGDVLIERIDSLPEGAEPISFDRGHAVLAYGEVTGHLHGIKSSPSVKLLGMTGTDDRFIVVGADAPIHELEEYEHAAIGKSYVDRCCNRGSAYPGAEFVRMFSMPAEIVTHDEHNVIPLAPGIYRSTLPVEYTPGALRRVVD